MDIYQAFVVPVTTYVTMYVPVVHEPAQPKIAALDLREQDSFIAMQACSMRLKSANQDLPDIEIGLVPFVEHLQQRLAHAGYPAEVCLIKDLAAQALGGPVSAHWNLRVSAVDTPEYQVLIHEATRDFILHCIPSQHTSVDTLKAAYGMDNHVLGNGWLYQFGPDITINFHHAATVPDTASALDSWSVVLTGETKGRASCKIGDYQLANDEELNQAAQSCRERIFAGVNLPGFVIPVVRALGQGATIRPDDAKLMAEQLCEMSVLRLSSLWREFETIHRPCPREQWVHFLNLLLLIQDDPELCKKVAEMWIRTRLPQPADPFAGAINQRPELTSALLNDMHGMLFDRWCADELLSLWSFPFIPCERNPRATAQIACQRGDRYLWLAAPQEASHPIDIAVRYVEGLHRLGSEKVDRSLFASLYALFGMTPITASPNKVARSLQDTWAQHARLRATLTSLYPDAGLDPIRLRRWLKKHSKEDAVNTLETKEPAVVAPQKSRKPRRVKAEKPQAQLAITFDYAAYALQEWTALKARSEATPAERPKILAQMTSEWREVKQQTASRPELLLQAAGLYADVLMQSQDISQFERLMGLAANHPGILNPERLAALYGILSHPSVSALAWSASMQAKMKAFFKHVQGTPQVALAPFFGSNPLSNLHAIAPFVFNSSLVGGRLTIAAIQDENWELANKYALLAQENQTPQQYKTYLDGVSAIFKKRVTDFLKKPSAEQSVALLTRVANSLPFFHTLIPATSERFLIMMVNQCYLDAFEHTEDVTRALKAFCEMLKDLKILKDDGAFQWNMSSALALSVAANPWKAHEENALSPWLIQLHSSTGCKEEEECVATRTVFFSCFQRLLGRVVTTTQNGTFLISDLQTFFATHWLPLMDKFANAGRVNVVLDGMFTMAIYTLSLSFMPNLMERLMSLERLKLATKGMLPDEIDIAIANSDVCELIKNYELWDNHQLEPLKDEERTLVVEGTLNVMEGRCAEQLRWLYHSNLSGVLAIFVTEVVEHSQKYFENLLKAAQRCKPAKRPVEAILDALTTNIRMVAFTRTCWEGTSLSAILGLTHAKLENKMKQLLHTTQRLNIKIAEQELKSIKRGDEKRD